MFLKLFQHRDGATYRSRAGFAQRDGIAQFAGAPIGRHDRHRRRRFQHQPEEEEEEDDFLEDFSRDSLFFDASSVAGLFWNRRSNDGVRHQTVRPQHLKFRVES